MKLFCFCVAIVLSVGVIAQPGKKDSLINLIRTKEKLDTGRLLAMTELSYLLWNINPDSSYLLADEANRLARKVGNLKVRGRALRQLGIYFRKKGNITQAQQYYDSAIEFGKQAKDDKGVASAQLSLGLVYQEKGNYAKALDLDFDALHTFERIQDLRSQGIIFLNVGQVYVQQKYYDKAIGYFKKGVQIFESINNVPLLGATTESLAYVYGLTKDYPKAIEIHLQAKRILEKTRDQHSLTYTYGNLAETYYHLGQNDKVLPYLEEGMVIATREGYDDRIADFNRIYAQYYNRIQQFDKALHYAGESQQLAQKVQNIELMRNATEQKFDALKNAHRYQEALETYHLFEQLKDSIQNQENRQLVLAKEFAFNEEKLKVENASLVNEAHLKEVTLQRTQLFVVILLLFCVILSLLVFNYYRALHRNKKLRLRVQEQNEEIQAQSEELFQAYEEITRINESLKSQVDFQTNQITGYAFQNAHNVRGPLARIIGLINLAEKGLIKEEEMPSLFQMISVSAKELDEIIKKINLSLEAGGIKEESSISPE